MLKIRLTKGELKKQRDALKQYQRYLPTLQLKKQQLQMEIIHQSAILEEKRGLAAKKKSATEAWAGLFKADEEIKINSVRKEGVFNPLDKQVSNGVNPTVLSVKTENSHLSHSRATRLSNGVNQWLRPKNIFSETRNIAGVDLPVFNKVEFVLAEYDLFSTPLWVDAAIEALRALISLQEEIKTVEKGVSILRQELRITTQRVNLFEKVKIPEAEEAIRLIKIYIGDQLVNAVGRSKIAKRKIEVLEEAIA